MADRLQKFVGCYYTEKRSNEYYLDMIRQADREKSPIHHTSTDKGNLKITLDDNNLTFKTCVKTVYTDGTESKNQKHVTVFNVDDNNKKYMNYKDEHDGKIIKCYFRSNNKITCDYQIKNLFGGHYNNGDEFSLNNDKFIRDTYINYGLKHHGFWFSGEHEKHIWTKVPDEDCDHI